MPKRKRGRTWTIKPGDTLTVEGVAIQVTKPATLKFPGVNPAAIVLTKREPKLRLDRPLGEE